MNMNINANVSVNFYMQSICEQIHAYIYIYRYKHKYKYKHISCIMLPFTTPPPPPPIYHSLNRDPFISQESFFQALANSGSAVASPCVRRRTTSSRRRKESVSTYGGMDGSKTHGSHMSQGLNSLYWGWPSHL